LTPDAIELLQNYPNPFNPTTVIRFTIAETQDLASLRARLRVVDILGRDVAVLVDGPMSAGSHSVTFDATGLPSGVYLYTLEVGGMTTTKRMVLVK
jgi:predicted deacylase